MVMGLLSPRGSQITTTTVAGAYDTSAGAAIELKWEFNEDLIVTMFRFLMISSGAQLGQSGI